MNILFIYPKMPFAFWSMSQLLKMAGKQANYPPVGLLTVAAMLPSEWNKRLVDLNLGPLGDADLAWADYAFIGAMNVQAGSARDGDRELPPGRRQGGGRGTALHP